MFSNRFTYALTKPKRFDVVSFRRLSNDPDSDVLVRRIIALPGESIRVFRGYVYINGVELDVSEYLSEITSDGLAETEIRLNQD